MTDLLSECFKIWSFICIFIFSTLNHLWIIYAPGHDARISASFWYFITKIYFQASDPHFLVAERKHFSPHTFKRIISSITVYFPIFQYTFPLGLCTPCSSTISILSWNFLPCDFILIVILTCPKWILCGDYFHYFGIITKMSICFNLHLPSPWLFFYQSWHSFPELNAKRLFIYFIIYIGFCCWTIETFK